MNISLTNLLAIPKQEQLLFSNIRHISFQTPEVNIYFEAKTLKEIEEAITKTIENELLLKKTLCILLSKIKLEELYKQLSFPTFKAYLKSRRLEISYSTAVEYARIGEMLLRYHDKLLDISFQEVDGLKKLLVLEKALQNNHAEEVFSRLKTDSFKEFCQYAKNARAFSLSEDNAKLEKKVDKHKITKDQLPEGKVILEDAKLYLSLQKNRYELLTFNRQYLEKSETTTAFKAFMEAITETANAYFLRFNKDLEKIFNSAS